MHEKRDPYPTDVTLNFRNESTDYWTPSYEVSIEIDVHKAKQIIAFLQKAFEL